MLLPAAGTSERLKLHDAYSAGKAIAALHL